MDCGAKQKRRPHPRERANPLSIMFFLYTLPVFFEGFRKDLEVSDLHEVLSEDKSNRLGNKLQAAWELEIERAKKRNRRPSLLRSLLKTFGPQLLLSGVMLVVLSIFFKIVQPLCLAQLISYFSPSPDGDAKITKDEAYLYATGVVLSSLFQVLLQHPYMLAVQHIAMKVRVACCSLIYRKSLKLNKSALGQTTAGQVVNLLSNDVIRFDLSLTHVHYMWVGPIQTAVVTYLMYMEVGISAVIGVVSLLLFIPLQVFLGRLSSKYRLKVAVRTDERIRLMNEIVSGIQVIKMYTWEIPFSKLVAALRKIEISSITGASYIRGIYTSFVMFVTRTSLYITILAHFLLQNDINARQVFVLTAFYIVLRGSMTIFFPRGLAILAETKVSIDRLNNFLLYEERDEATINKDLGNRGCSIFIKDGTAKWLPSSTDSTLLNLNIEIKPGSLIGVIGPVGSGKSSLLQVILKELPLAEGQLDVGGQLSYASQEPWLFGSSVQQNILFGQEMNEQRYRDVVKVCSLGRDFQLLPYGDKTSVSDRGVSLSGGQKARINLARAVYRDADIYLLDDPLSAVDARVGKEIFENCIKRYLADKTVVLVTHQLQYLKDVDHILIVENGTLKTQGTFNDLQNSKLDFARLLESNGEEVKEDETGTFTRQASITMKQLEDEKNPEEVKEHKSVGTISGYVYKSYILAGGNCFTIFGTFIFFIIAQCAYSLGDYFITYWVNLEQKHAEAKREPDINKNGTASFWDFSTETSIYIYTGLTVATIMFTFVRVYAFFTMCMKSSIKLHNRMFNCIIHATMRFFNTNAAGRILNRFSKDMGTIDERLPLAMFECVQIGLSLIATLIVIATVNVWLLIPSVILAIVFYLMLRFYLRTGRNIQRLEGVTRSPVFSHLSASLQGLTTIRACGVESILEKEFDGHQDLHSSAWFSYIATSTAFGYFMDLICVIYLGILTYSFLLIGNETYGGNVGLVITQSLGITGALQWGMRQTAEMENTMTSVERVLEYTNIKSEPPLETPQEKKPPSSWPFKGEIKFVKLFLYYFPDDPPILKNLSFTIMPLEKIGIVGRTGAGKSSLISALFRLTEIKGSVVIDDIDTADLGLHELRSKLSIIPQEPVLFSGTARKNLDPFDEYDDETLWKALEEVGLKDVINDMPAGLNSKISEGGTNFSVGQRQLICLARAIVRNNKILVLDEATANVDPQTDAVIQTTIKKKFNNCTVLTIAHRLHTVMDSDKVLVMDAGTMVEFDHPSVLLQNQTGVFYGMVQQTGKSTAENLIKMADDLQKLKSQRLEDRWEIIGWSNKRMLLAFHASLEATTKMT